MSHSAFRQERAEDLERLRRLIGRSLPSPPVGTGSETHILDVACGACEEADALSDFFSTLDASKSPSPASTSLVGIDIRRPELDEARRRFRNSPGRKFAFLAGDASKLAEHRELRENFDVVFLRHQNLFHGRVLWQRIFEQSLWRLDENGVLIMTSYFDREHALAIGAFNALGAELVTSVRNDESRVLSSAGKSVDRHLAVFRKPAPRSA